jgi:hypothetical protein
MNLAMQRKVADGEARDIGACERVGPYYLLATFMEDVDYCDLKAGVWIWSIGRRLSDGVILASPRNDLYQNGEFECLWLR